MKKLRSNLALILIFVIGLSLLLYPSVSNYWNSIYQSRAIKTYVSAVENLGNEEYEAMLASAADYNTRLRQSSVGLNLPTGWQQDYDSQLKLGEDGLMGYIRIDKIDLELPIYHGTSEAVLRSGVGHLDGTSLPVGGESTHCVLSGHRGLPSAVLFSNLDQIEAGDTFVLHILDETLTYEVEDIAIVLPEETEQLQIVEGQDLCTLVTCTPYGVNTHRLLVRGHRVANAEQKNIRVSTEASQIDPVLVAPVIAAPMLLVLLLWLLLHTKKPKKSDAAAAAEQGGTEHEEK